MRPGGAELQWCEGGCGLIVPLALMIDGDGRARCAACGAPARGPSPTDLRGVLEKRLVEFVGPERAAQAVRDLANGGGALALALRDLEGAEARAREAAALLGLLASDASTPRR